MVEAAGAHASGTNGVAGTAVVPGATDGGAFVVSVTGWLATGAVSTTSGFFSSGSHPVCRDFSRAICSNPPARQSFALFRVSVCA